MPTPTNPQQSREGASWAGFHFTNLYQNCPKKFYFRFVLRLEPKQTPYALIQGSAFHQGKETFYRTGDADKALEAAWGVITDRGPELATDELRERLEYRLPTLLESWIDTQGWKDLEDFQFLHIEDQAVMSIPGTEFVFTAKPDTIVRERSGSRKLIVLETKTSGFSKTVTEQGVRNGDQATSYYWATKHLTGEYPWGVLPDITYWNNRSSNPEKIEHVRGDLVQRMPNEVEEFKQGVGQIIAEISQKTEAVVEETHEPAAMFPRNTHYCMAYGHPCEFLDICRTDLSRFKGVPPGYTVDEIPHDVASHVEDILGVVQ